MQTVSYQVGTGKLKLFQNLQARMLFGILMQTIHVSATIVRSSTIGGECIDTLIMVASRYFPRINSVEQD